MRINEQRMRNDRPTSDEFFTNVSLNVNKNLPPYSAYYSLLGRKTILAEASWSSNQEPRDYLNSGYDRFLPHSF
jgi:hypothetical protein